MIYPVMVWAMNEHGVFERELGSNVRSRASVMEVTGRPIVRDPDSRHVDPCGRDAVAPIAGAILDRLVHEGRVQAVHDRGE